VRVGPIISEDSRAPGRTPAAFHVLIGEEAASPMGLMRRGCRCHMARRTGAHPWRSRRSRGLPQASGTGYHCMARSSSRVLGGRAELSCRIQYRASRARRSRRAGEIHKLTYATAVPEVLAHHAFDSWTSLAEVAWSFAPHAEELRTSCQVVVVCHLFSSIMPEVERALASGCGRARFEFHDGQPAGLVMHLQVTGLETGETAEPAFASVTSCSSQS
jgi:hypothetical protein